MPHKLLVPDPMVEEVLASLGDDVVRLRAALGRSQAWVGRACGLSQSTVSRLEAGAAPSLRLERYARVLAVLRTGRVLSPWEPMSDDDRFIHARTKRPYRRPAGTFRQQD